MTLHDLMLDESRGRIAPGAHGARPFDHVCVHLEADARVLAIWADLETKVPCSIYQTRAWILPWVATLGQKAGLVPIFVIARDGDGTAVALFCLGVGRRGFARVAGFLGGKDSNINLGLFRDAGDWSRADLVALLSSAARQLGPNAPDTYVLRNQAETWEGVVNPLSRVNARPSPSAAYGTSLPAKAEDLFAAKLSKQNCKKLRKKEARLALSESVTYKMAETASERTAFLDVFLAQRIARFDAQGIAYDYFADPLMRRFIELASTPAPNGLGLELHALFVGERIVAVYGGGAHRGHWSGMFNSFDLDPELAKSSPGELLLMALIAKQCALGMTKFDLGIGEARYKTSLCDEQIPLFDSFIAITVKGAIFAKGASSMSVAKSVIKRNPVVFRWARRVLTLRLRLRESLGLLKS